MSDKTRPTKKQFELLLYLRDFIAEHGYSPSYREIMRGCNYSSVATVALHVNSLMKRGHVIKRDKSARSLEVVGGLESAEQPKKNQLQELITEVDNRLKSLEAEVSQEILDEVYVLVGALKVLGHTEVAHVYAGKIQQLEL